MLKGARRIQQGAISKRAAGRCHGSTDNLRGKKQPIVADWLWRITGSFPMRLARRTRSAAVAKYTVHLWHALGHHRHDGP